MSELDDPIYQAMLVHTTIADELCEGRQWEAAIREYDAAWNLLPEPKGQWSSALWILGSISEAAFHGGFYGTVIESLEYAMLSCPDAVGNPLLHLRLGQAYFEKDQLDSAANELVRAYMHEGEEIFSDEDEKYLTFLFSRIKKTELNDPEHSGGETH